MQSIHPLVRDLVLVGGGHTHALLLRMWGMRPVPGVRLTLINPDPVAAYSGMLPGHVAGHYPREALEIDLVTLARFAGARLILGAAGALDAEAQRIEVPGRAALGFDLCSIDIGITARMPALPGFADHALPAKPLGDFARGWAGFVARVTTGEVAPQVAVIGGGIAGVELALTMRHRLAGAERPVEVTVIDRGPVLAGVSARSKALLLARMAAAGIAVLDHAAIARVTPEGPVLDDGRLVPAVLTVGAAGAAPAPWLAGTGLALHEGFVAVDAMLRSTSHPAIFAAGDCAHLTAAPRPKAGVFAVRAAAVLDHNLRATLAERPLRPFRPQQSYLKLVSLGPREALAQKGPLTRTGPLMWRWKDRIDRRFMDRFQTLPAMPAAPLPKGAPAALRRALPDDQPMCGGCGAKVGAGALGAALATLPAPVAPELVNRPGDDAAILQAGRRWQVISTDHLRAVTEDWEVMTRIALNHAMGDVWAMGARPQIALAQIVIPRMTAELQARTLAEITAAAADGCARIGAALAGGHTTMGAETTIGFTVTGLRASPPVTKGGAQPGDVLLLTRPLGSGTLLSAEMQRKARGAWIAGLLAILTEPQDTEAALLAEAAHAMTDVTGFGLAGHALELADASGVALELTLGDLPLYEGAAALAASGLRSTLFADNRAATSFRVSGAETGPAAPLLYDPQTCGGLLAALPPKEAMIAMGRIAAAGGRAWTVGRVLAGPPGLVLV